MRHQQQHPPHTHTRNMHAQVINRLIKLFVFAVSFAPNPDPGESDADYQNRAQQERALVLHESYNPDP